MKRRPRGEGSLFFEQAKGLWVARVTLPDGKRRVRYAKTQKEVKDWLLGVRNELRTGMLPKDDSITVSEYMSNYMENVARHNLRPKTFETYQYLLTQHVLPTLGRIKLTQLRADHL